MKKFLIIFVYGLLCSQVGYFTANYIHTKMLDDKIKEINEAARKLKDRNNEFLNNFLSLYHYSTDTEGQFTDMDECVMDMWME